MRPRAAWCGAELWADVLAHPAVARLEALAQAHGQSIDSDGIAYYITRPLLLDVIHAAGGVEYTVEKLVAALDIIQRQVDEYGPAAWEPAERGSW